MRTHAHKLMATAGLSLAVALTTSAEVITVDLPELTGTFVHGQTPIPANFGFANLYYVNSFTLTITATGTVGTDENENPVPAEFVLDVPGNNIVFDPAVLGPYGVTPTTTVHDIPLMPIGFLDCIGFGCPQTYSLIGAVELSTHDIYPNLTAAPMVHISDAYLTMDAEFCDGIDDPIGCYGFIGIEALNIVLGAWNQNVPPADPLADWSGDGYVGIEDLNWVLSRWNAGTPPGAVPEPVALALLAAGVLPLIRRRRR